MALLTTSRFLESLPTFSPIAARLLGLTGDRASVSAVSELVGADPALTADVLRMANSPLYGRQREIDSLQQAMALLGMDRVRGIVLTVAMRDFSCSAKASPVFQQCWRHSLGCGVIAGYLAAAASRDRDTGYTIGLLHDAGRLALLAAKPHSYGRLLKAGAASVLEMWDNERELFGVDHCEAGGWLAEAWRLPLNVRIGMQRHHECGGDPRGYHQIVHVACELATLAGFHSWGEPRKWKPESVRALLPDASPEFLDGGQLVQRVTEEVSALENMLM